MLAFEVVPVDESLATAGGQLRQEYHASHGVGLADALIAVSAMKRDAELARNRQDNPITDQMFLDYLVSQHVTVIEDPVTGEKIPVYDWLQSRIIGAGESVYSIALNEFGLDPSFPLNYERNYLAAMFNENPTQVIRARREFRRRLKETFEDDAVAAYEYISSLDQLSFE